MNMLKLWLHSVLIKRQVIQHQPQWRLNYYLRNSFFVTPTDNPSPSRCPPRVDTASHNAPRAWPTAVLSCRSPRTTAECIQVGDTNNYIYYTINWPDAVLMAH